MGWLAIGIPVAIGFLLGIIVPVWRPVLHVGPALAIALVWWIAAGWFGHDNELEHSFLVLITGAISAGFVALWAVGVGLGRSARAASSEGE